ncbi:nitroreductase/quinone reductase family protein [Mycobacterium sp. 4D054]|uniref:nitroreductase/quinone reductase family protein n=1 Tax=Mycobacterium sp. 4D054 TaxID=3457440 RepID=UPI003FD2C6FA
MPETIDVAHPPEALLKVVNPTLRFALRTPLGGALKQFMLVSFTGRKTGRRFTVPVSAHHLDGDFYVILEAGWKHNFRDGATAEVTHNGKTTRMHGQLITDPAAVADIVHRVAASYGVKKAQQSMGLKFGGDTVPTREEFQSAATRLGIAAIRLTPAT